MVIYKGLTKLGLVALIAALAAMLLFTMPVHAADATVTPMPDASAAVTALGLSALVAAGVAVVKGLWSGEMPVRAVYATIGILTAVLLGLASASGELHANAYQLVAQWLLQAAGAIGMREGLVTVTGGAAGRLPSRGDN